MKKISLYILISVVIIGILSPFHFVSADLIDTGVAVGLGSVLGGGQVEELVAKEVYNAVGDKIVAGAWETTMSILANMAYSILKLMSLLLYLAGAGLDYVLTHTVLDMSTNIPKMTGINIGWKLLRDLMNIAFIFLLVWEGIKMIIGQGSQDGVRKFITSIVIASILVNFSLFFTKILIDASNVVTVGFYNSIINPDQKINVSGSNSEDIRGLSVPFMQALGVSKVYSRETFKEVSGGKDENMLIIGIAGSILFRTIETRPSYP